MEYTQLFLPAGVIFTIFFFFWQTCYSREFWELATFKKVNSKLEVLVSVFCWVSIVFTAWTVTYLCSFLTNI